MNLFGSDFTKPGPGISADEPEKKGFFKYWEIVFEKFSKHMGANAMHAVLSIVSIVIFYILAPVNLGFIQSIIQNLAEGAEDTAAAVQSLTLSVRMMFAAGMFALWGGGPATAAYAYIARCFTRRKPVWVVSDGLEKYKENFKQGIFVFITDIIMLILMTGAITFYYSQYAATGDKIWLALCVFMVIVAIMFTWAHFYIYQLMVTFKYKISELYKNAFLLALATLPMNLFITVLTFVITVTTFSFLNAMGAIVLDLVILKIFTRFVIEFYAARRVKALILDKIESAE